MIHPTRRHRLPLLLFFLLGMIPGLATAQESKNFELTVAKGDYLVRICETYLEEPEHWPEIAQLNHLGNPDLILPGQKLLIPVRLLKGVPIKGTVTFIKGPVEIQQKDGPWNDLSIGQQVSQGSAIRTGDQATVEITFEDNTTLLLRANTLLSLDKARQQNKTFFLYDLFLDAGRAISRLKKLTGKESRYRIHTPSAIAGARGTKFRVSVDTQQDTRCEVLEGEVGVTASQTEVVLAHGSGTLVRQGAQPAAPVELLTPPRPKDLAELYRSMPLSYTYTSQGAAKLRVLLARDSELKDIVKEKTFAPDQALEIFGVEDGTYYLSGRAIDHQGIEGLPGPTLPVRVRVNPLPPYIQSPRTGIESKERSMQFQWLKVADAARYHVQIATDADFTTVILDDSEIMGLSLSHDQLDFTTYYFRISSIAADEYEGIWSDTISFTIIPPPPAPPMEPPKVDDDTITMRWRHLGPGVRYHVQMAREPEFSEPLLDTVVDQPELTVDKPRESGAYYVRTSALDPDGYEGSYSLPQSFEVKSSLGLVVLSVLTALILIIAP